MVKTVLPLGMHSVNEYDKDDNLISYTDFNGDKTEYFYDEYGKQTGIKYSQGSNIDYTYDEYGKLTEADFNGNVTQYSYNNINGLEKVTNSNGTYVEYDYDKIGNVTSVTTNFGKTSYTYDLLNRLKTVTDSNGTTTYTYDCNGNLTSSVNLIGISQYYTYDNCNRLTEEVVKDSENVVIAKYSYTLDKMGRRIKVNETGLTDRTITYTYDNLNRLESEEITENGKTVKIEYSFDSGNNRIQKIEDGKVTKYTYDANNRLITEGNKTYNYDKNGNTISITENGKTTVYTYFDFGKLKSVDNGSTKETYTYDHQGRRTAKETTINGQTEVINYLLDDNGLVYNVLAEYDNNINAKTTYTIGNTLISLTTNGNTNYYLTDGTGSTRALADTTGNITDAYTYDAYGNITFQTGNTYNPYLYNQEQYDQNTGLYYQIARYIIPTTGRFITQDSYGGNTYDPASLHRYNYANGNPITGSDPTGYFNLKEMATTVAIFGILGGIINSAFSGVTRGIIVAETLINQGEEPSGEIFKKSISEAGKAAKSSFFPGVLEGAKFGAAFYVGGTCGSWSFVGKGYIAVTGGKAVASGTKTTIQLTSEGNYVSATVVAAETALQGYGTFKAINYLNTTSACFTAGTLVSTENGKKPIEEICVGDYVWSENLETGKKELKKVIQTFIRKTDEIIEVFEDNTFVETTAEHPFYVKDKGWICAKDLNKGDILLSLNDKEIVITKIKIKKLLEPVTVYNFEVEDNHTYFVGLNKILVHNTCNLNTGKKTLIKKAQLPTKGKIRFVPPEKWNATETLNRTNTGGYIDKFGNIWEKGPSRTASEPFEWNVQLSNIGKDQLGWASRDGSHINVSLKGGITHQ